MKRITMKDLARQLGVNASTVSRALKNHPDISPALRARIQELAEALHYRPNHMAVYLRQRSSRLVGLIIPQMTMFFYPALLRGIEDVMHRQGFSLLMLPSHESLEREEENLQICFDNDVAGLLISFSRETTQTAHLSQLEDAGAPIVMFDNVLENAPFDSVVLDDYSDAVTAVRQLYANGCRNIAGVFGNVNLRITQLRLKGFTDALKELGLPVDPDSIFFADNPVEAAACARALGGLPKCPDGIFAMSDEILTGLFPGLLDRGIRMPDDCALICMSDGSLPRFFRPEVSHLLHDGYQLGGLAAERLCALIESAEHLKANYRGQRTVLTAPLMPMGTTRAGDAPREEPPAPD